MYIASRNNEGPDRTAQTGLHNNLLFECSKISFSRDEAHIYECEYFVVKFVHACSLWFINSEPFTTKTDIVYQFFHQFNVLLPTSNDYVSTAAFITVNHSTESTEMPIAPKCESEATSFQKIFLSVKVPFYLENAVLYPC